MHKQGTLPTLFEADRRRGHLKYSPQDDPKHNEHDPEHERHSSTNDEAEHGLLGNFPDQWSKRFRVCHHIHRVGKTAALRIQNNRILRNFSETTSPAKTLAHPEDFLITKAA